MPRIARQEACYARRRPCRAPLILADTSAWVEFLRATGSPTHLRMRGLAGGERTDALITTEVVVMELLAGARSDDHAARLGRLLARFRMVPLEGLGDFEAAAAMHRACARRGQTVRQLTDCLVAAVAIRVGAAVLHRDRGFDVIARWSSLRLTV